MTGRYEGQGVKLTRTYIGHGLKYNGHRGIREKDV